MKIKKKKKSYAFSGCFDIQGTQIWCQKQVLPFEKTKFIPFFFCKYAVAVLKI